MTSVAAALRDEFAPLLVTLDERRREIDVAQALLANQLACLALGVENCVALSDAPTASLGAAAAQVDDLRRRLEAVQVRLAIIAERLRLAKRRVAP